MRASTWKDRGCTSRPWSLMMSAGRGWLALGGEGTAAAPSQGERHMRWKRIQGVLMGFGLAALLTIGVGSWGVASAAPQSPVQAYTGQVREINIDQCGLEPGTCEGSLVLAQARGQEVDLAIPAGTAIQRGGQRVHLEELGVGNYVMVQAAPLSPVPQGNGGRLNWGQIRKNGHQPMTSGH